MGDERDDPHGGGRDARGAEVSQCYPRNESYRPIADYALFGDCHGVAHVSRDGSTDWATLRRFDADPVFYRLLDAARGGALGRARRESVGGA